MVSSIANDVTSPPTIGAAIRFMTSAPVPVLHMTGKSASIVVRTVMSLGRILRAASSTMVSRRSSNDRSGPCFERGRWANLR
jgi:hypothetical protein